MNPVPTCIFNFNDHSRNKTQKKSFGKYTYNQQPSTLLAHYKQDLFGKELASDVYKSYHTYKGCVPIIIGLSILL